MGGGGGAHLLLLGCLGGGKSGRGPGGGVHGKKRHARQVHCHSRRHGQGGLRAALCPPPGVPAACNPRLGALAPCVVCDVCTLCCVCRRPVYLGRLSARCCHASCVGRWRSTDSSNRMALGVQREPPSGLGASRTVICPSRTLPTVAQ